MELIFGQMNKIYSMIHICIKANDFIVSIVSRQYIITYKSHDLNSLVFYTAAAQPPIGDNISYIGAHSQDEAQWDGSNKYWGFCVQD